MRILRIFRIKFINKSEMLKVLTFMKQVANGLQVEGNFGTAHVYRSSLNAIIAYSGKVDFTFDEVSPEWLKGFEVYLRSRGCSWNTVSTYLRTFRAVYNRAVDLRKASYVPHLFRSVYTGTRADHKRALGDEDMKKVFAKLSRTSGVPLAVYQAQELFILMFSLRGMPFVEDVYKRQECEMEKPYILIYDKKISNLKDFLPSTRFSKRSRTESTVRTSPSSTRNTE